MPDTTPLPLPECPREDCAATIDHWHDGEGTAFDCSRQLGRADRAIRCYAPRTQPAPQPPALTLPTVDEAARAIFARAWRGEAWEHYTKHAQAVLDLIAARITPWRPVAPGTVIKAGTRYRVEYAGGGASEHVAAAAFIVSVGACRYYIDPRTVPAEPSGVERACRLLSFAHGVTVTPEQIRATLDELGLELTENAMAADQ